MLQFKQVSKYYQTGQIQQQALKHISEQIQTGEMIGLCGPSGSGKSTLLNICGLLDLSYQGELYFDGHKLDNDPQHCMILRRQQLGFVFQRFNLVPVMSAFENVEYPLMLNQVAIRERKQRVMQILDAVGMAEFAHSKPDRLSGGQQQRIAVARALVHKPRLVIADEPTASLDSHTAHQVVELMKDIGKSHQTTFVIATHDSRMSEHCSRLIQLQDGQILAKETATCVA
ncbi:ABC transporter ATP-binding protein [Agarivorans sp. Toyoura001]|uniref:ABC transporter ATP-binding protein n=1 Tax=unclassified Agarivorans TaxID=2636026 RepID=UPI0010D13913|nr:ABC transporter ATP-binding protein [Agarivorans sp. Toyoura001]GDY25157.1 lipoprotein ABC transporter ATP-binding protein LolD [Agarivorans sp. Toyoura001]